MLKRIFCLLIIVSFFVGGIPALANNSSVIVCNLSDFSAIKTTGMPASSVHNKSGSFTMCWSGADIFRDITIPAAISDISGYNYLEMWIYSVSSAKTQFTLALMSNNTSTTAPDYYYTTVNVNWSGWKLVSLKLSGTDSVFKTAGSPVGLNKIDNINLLSQYGGKQPAPTTSLYFDNITAITEASVPTEDTPKEFMIADFSNAANVKAAGFEPSAEQTYSGDVSLKWAPPNISKSPAITLPTKDFSKYLYLNLTIYCATPKEDNVLRLVLTSENPETSGADYYMGDISLGFTGWKTISLIIGDMGSFAKARTPLGWDQIEGLTFWTSYGYSNVSEDMVMYLDRIYLSGSPEEFAYDPNNEFILKAVSKPNDKDIISMVKEKTKNSPHPRLLFNEQQFENLKSLAQTDTFMKKTSDNIIASADATMKIPIAIFRKNSFGTFNIDIYERLPPLALAYKLTGNENYKNRLWQELESICNFPEWNAVRSILNTADIARYVSYVYDWLYYDWTESQRMLMRNALVKNLYIPCLAPLRNNTGFTILTNNWNPVVNSAVGITALAIGDQPGYEAMANEILNRSIEALPASLNTFAPDGAGNEDPGYWGYAMRTFFQYVASLYSAAGHDFDLSQFEGLSNTGYLPIAMAGPTNVFFNYGDCEANSYARPIEFYIAGLYNKPDIFGREKALHLNDADWMHFVLYNKALDTGDYGTNMPLDFLFNGEVPVASLRNTWTDSNGLYVGFKGGYNKASHGDLDIGTFVLDAQGTRFVEDLGHDDYGKNGMFVVWKGGGRWTYYRKRAEGNNTLVINPKPSEDQNLDARGPIYKFEKSPSAAYGLIDMSEAYSEDVASAKRGIALINGRSQVLVQDEVKTTSPVNLYSFFHTAAKITVSSDGKSAILDRDGKKIRADLLTDGAFTVMDAVPLPGSATPLETNAANIGITKLTVYLENATNPNITVLFTPINDVNETIVKPQVLPLTNWDDYLNSSISLQGLSINNIPLSSFSQYNFSYSDASGMLGTVSATADKDVTVEITQAENINDTAYIYAKSKTTDATAIYKVEFYSKIPRTLTQDLPKYKAVGAKSSAVPQPDTKPENSIDGQMETYWAAEGEQWIEWDLGEVKNISGIELSFNYGSTRQQIFNLQVSEDGVNYETVFDGKNSGKTEDFEEFSFNKKNARYVRLNGKGNTTNKWNNCKEVRFVAAPKEFSDITVHWAKADIKLMAKAALVNGINDMEFSPESTVTRAEFIAMLVRAARLKQGEYKGGLLDVSENDWYANAIQTALSWDLIPEAMLTDNKIQPNAFINREEMSALITRTYEKTTGSTVKTYGLSKLTDATSISDWAKVYVDKGITLRIIQGINDDTFAPLNNATRAQAATLIKRLFILITE